MSDSESRDCHAAALRLLSRREHSVKELRQKLVARGFEARQVEQVLSQLTGDRLLSDERFAESYIRSKMGKGVGPVRLRQELRDHGVADEMIERYLLEHDWWQLASSVRQKRFGKILPSAFDERAKQMRFLQYRGFSMEQINSTLKHADWE